MRSRAVDERHGEAGKTAPQLGFSYTLAEAKRAGYVEGLKAAGYTCAEAKQAGYTLAEMKQGGYTLVEMKAAGYSSRDVKAAGFGPQEAFQAGYSKDDTSRDRYGASHYQ